MLEDSEALRDKFNITAYEVSFAGPQKSRPEQICWNIHLAIDDYPFVLMYSTGVGHIPGYRHSLKKTLHQADQEKLAIESGRYLKDENSALYSNLPRPTLLRVLSCVVSDGQAVEYMSFEDWAGEMGYDEDSRKAESIYNECLKAGLFLRNSLGESLLEELKETISLWEDE